MVELQENKEKVTYNLFKYQDKMKAMFEKKVEDKIFQPSDLVLRWDVRREYNGKHGKFDSLRFGPFKVVEAKGNNTFLLENIDGEVFDFPEMGSTTSTTLNTKVRYPSPL